MMIEKGKSVLIKVEREKEMFEMPRFTYNKFYRNEVPSELEIYAMYLTEGMAPSEASKKAKIIHREMSTLAQREVRLWKRVRVNELSSGIDPINESI